MRLLVAVKSYYSALRYPKECKAQYYVVPVMNESKYFYLIMFNELLKLMCFYVRIFVTDSCDDTSRCCGDMLAVADHLCRNTS